MKIAVTTVEEPCIREVIIGVVENCKRKGINVHSYLNNVLPGLAANTRPPPKSPPKPQELQRDGLLRRLQSDISRPFIKALPPTVGHAPSASPWLLHSAGSWCDDVPEERRVIPFREVRQLKLRLSFTVQEPQRKRLSTMVAAPNLPPSN